MRWTFEKAHAGLYRYLTEGQLAAAFARVEARLDRALSELEFFRLLVPLVDLIHDAHTSLRPGTAVIKYVVTTAKVFPLDVRYVGGRAFVEKNFGPNQMIPLGAEILSVNGTPMPLITEKVLAVKSADGLNRVPKYEVANVNFWINYFEMVDDSEEFRVELRDPRTGKIERHKTPGVPAQLLQSGQFKLQPRDTFTLEFIEGGRVALMRIPSFGDLALAGQFADAFREIKEKGVRTLVIDIRDNGGGWDELNTELLSYLVPHPFRFYKGFTFRAKNWDALKYVKYSADDFLNAPDLKRYSEAERAKMVTER
ncbi:MAG TPA: S41 family peptidase, partial [Pyrinomonadaceae bacterium]|nr:S41 family peptidase [Pyrinomonadaceae bacterium]